MNDEKIILSYNNWKLNAQDRRMVLGVISCLIILSYLLHLNFSQRSSSSGKRIGVVIIKKNIVQRKNDGSLIWESAKLRYPAYEKDTIRAGELSSGVVVLDKSNVEIDLDENTMLVLDFLKSDSVSKIQFEYGSLRIRQPEQGAQQPKPDSASFVSVEDEETDTADAEDTGYFSFFGHFIKKVRTTFQSLASVITFRPKSTSVEIKSKNEEFKLEGGEVQLVKDDSTEELKVTNLSGTAKIITKAGKEEILTSNEALTLKNGQTQKKERSIALTQRTPPDGEYIFARRPFEAASTSLTADTVKLTYRALVKFKWKISDEAKNKLLEVSKYRDFSAERGRVIRQKAKGKALSLSLKEGTYYWRISGKGTDNSKREYSPVRKFTIVSKDKVIPYEPIHKQKFTYQIKPPLVAFSWGGGKYASSYLLEIASDSDFKEIIKKYSTSSKNHAASLEEGKYYWRVSTKSAISQATVTSKTSKLRIIRNEESTPAQIKTYEPAPEVVLSQKELSTKGRFFNWEAHPEASLSHIVIAQDDSMNQIVLKETSINNFYTLKSKLENGRYYWMIQSFTETEEVIAMSAVQMFDLKADKKADSPEESKGVEKENLQEENLEEVITKIIEKADKESIQKSKITDPIEGEESAAKLKKEAKEDKLKEEKPENDDPEVKQAKEEDKPAPKEPHKFLGIHKIQTIRLKNNKVIEGAILKHTDKLFHIRTKKGVIKVNIDEIERISG